MKQLKITSSLTYVITMIACIVPVFGSPAPAEQEDNLVVRDAAHTHITFNGYDFQAAVDENILRRLEDVNVRQNDSIRIAAGDLGRMPRILIGYQYNTRSLQTGRIEATYRDAETLAINVTGALADHPKLSDFRLNDVVLTYDEVARHILNGKVVAGQELPLFSGYKSSLIQCKMLDSEGVLDSNGPIDIEAEQIKFSGQFVRTPTGLYLKPHDDIKDTAIITEIIVTPWRYIYKDSQGLQEQSWTSYVDGTVNFRTGEVTLTVFNASISMTLNKNLPL